MTLHIIVDFVKGNKALNSLSDSANERGVDVNVVCAKTTDYLNLPDVQPGDILYRHGLSARGIDIERLVIKQGVGHFYKSVETAMGKRTSSYFYNEKAGLPVVKTIPLLPNSDSDIAKHVEHLGGFPVVLKVMGGSKGVGVMRADSIESLKSILDYVRGIDSMVLLRAFVPHKYYGRLVVVGSEIAGSHRTFVMPDEFRSNAPGNIEKNKEGFIFPEEVQKTAIDAVHSLGLNYGGVDLMFTEDGLYYISEVNFPCSFPSTERIARADISGKMIDFLLSCEHRDKD